MAVPAPEAPLPARAIGEHDFQVGRVRLHIVSAPSSEARGEWSDELQPAMFRAYLSRARGP
jgi:hypothetical protein